MKPVIGAAVIGLLVASVMFDVIWFGGSLKDWFKPQPVLTLAGMIRT